MIRAVIGLDGGSTSSKAVLVDEAGEIVCKAYQLSKGNPIQDAKELLTQLRDHVQNQGATLEVLGFGATGYAADVLEETVRADVNIVETVAHMMSAVRYCGEVDVICDIGGQDIKVLFMKNGDIANFRLSNSCSAGNGMLLQAMADQFGLPVTEYADTAFGAELAPKFSYGCAVFLDTDRVNFQKEGFSKEELLAGLAQVLPKNVWQYVVQIPRLAALGTRYVLQGGTQYNLAAVKAQVDYIKERVPGAQVFVHPHTGEAGALGAAFETLRVIKRRGTSTFIGLEAAINLDYTTKNDDETVCHFCPNNCKRTFIDATRPDGSTSRYISGFSLREGDGRERGGDDRPGRRPQEDRQAVPQPRRLRVEAGLPPLLRAGAAPARGRRSSRTPSSRRASSAPSASRRRAPSAATAPRCASGSAGCASASPGCSTSTRRAPYFRTYFEAIGIPKQNVVFSDATTEEMWVEGGKYGSIDPCFPSKVAQAHIHNLLFHHHSPQPGVARRRTTRSSTTSSSPSSRTCRASARA